MGGCLRPHDSLWDGAHDARLTGDVVDEILGGKVDRADWSVAPDDPGTGARPRHKLSLPYPAFSSCPFAQVDEDDATRIYKILRAFFCLDLAGWICAAWAVLGPLASRRHNLFCILDKATPSALTPDQRVATRS